MARITTPLSDKEIRAASPQEKSYKLFDGGGLYLEVPPKQKKRWRLKYRFEGKEKTLSLGTYPDVSLKDARKKREELKALLAQAMDPSSLRKEKKESIEKEKIESANTFSKSALEYIEHLRPERNEKYWRSVEHAFHRDVFPIIGEKNIREVTPRDIIQVLEHIKMRGAIETAHRLFTQISKVFQFAVSYGHAERNPCNDMDKRHILQAVRAKHYATITEDNQIGKLLYDLNKYKGDYATRMALCFAPYVAVRPHNIRYSRWKEIDFENKVWRIPAEEMKTKREHLVPLTDTVLALLTEMHRFSGDGEYIFPSSIRRNQPLSETTLNQALRRMGYDNKKIVTHGFRAMFSTIAHEKSPFRSEVIEIQLGHKIGSEVSRAYNRAQYLQERKELMQWWSDYLDEQKERHIVGFRRD